MARVTKPVKKKTAAKPSTRKSAGTGAQARSLAQRLKDALDQQAATSEILRVMAGSPTDVQPVLDAVAQRAADLCHSRFARVFLAEGDVLRPAAQYSASGETSNPVYAVPLRRTSISGHATLDCKTIHLANVIPLLATRYPDARENVLKSGMRAVLAVPLARDSGAYGAIILWRRERGLFSSDQVALVQTFARQAAIAIENVQLFRATQEALERQTATSEILRVISSSPTDVQPVFDAIVRSAVRLCGADHSIAARFDGEFLHPLAHHGFSKEALKIVERTFPMKPNLQNMLGRAALSKSVDNLADMLFDPTYSHDFAIAGGWRSGLSVPMLRDGELIGAIAVSRREPGAFPKHLVDLLTTFADQAVIAVENVRLFKELEARNADLVVSLEQQTATSEILRAISQSPTDVQPVFDTIAANALRLCDAVFSVVYRFDGELIHVAALHNVSAVGSAAFRSVYPCPPHEGGATQRAVLTGRVVHMPDIRDDPKYMYKDAAEAADYRSVLSVPMLRGGVVLGAITVFRAVARAFPEAQVALLQTFAEQAVIAVENVRLFKELGARNRELTEALEQQTATSEILRLIAGTPTDTQPVFELLAQRAGRLCDAEVAVVSRYDGSLIELAAVHGIVPEAVEVVRKHYPLRIEGQTTLTARAIRDGTVVHSGDVLADSAYETKDFARAANFRAGVAVPIIREGKVIGSIFAGRAAPGLFTDSQVDLLKTFADQAAIAIENVRLFKALDSRNTELSQSLERQTATSDILRVISQSPTDTQPVFDTIAAAVLKLCNAGSALVAEFDGELITLAALANVDPRGTDAMRRSFPRRPGRDSATALSIFTRDIAAIPDVLEDVGSPTEALRVVLGMRSILSVPLMREGNPIGAISVWRTQPGAFPDDQVVLLKTFADQAVIAIENVRLFKALEARNADLTEALEQQTATSNILRVIGQSQTDAQPVFDTIVAAAMKLCGANSANVFTFDGDMIHLAALVNATSEGAEAIRRMWPQRPSRQMAASRAILTNDVVCIPDVLDDPAFGANAPALAGSFRSILSVPLIRDGEPVGAIAVGRPNPGLFPDEQIALLKTFADQAVIAIENVRLFTELQRRNQVISEALEQQTATSEILRVISASPRDVQPVFDAIASAALRLCAATTAMVARYDGKLVHLVAIANVDPGGLAALREVFPRPLSRDTTSTRAILSGEVIIIPDVLADADYAVGVPALRAGYRSTLAVPLLQGGRPIGCITVGRSEAGAFADSQVALLQTFADQAVIAIENVRLVTELEARTTELTKSVAELRALGDVGQAVSSTLDVETVLSTIVSRANELAGTDGGAIYEYDETHEVFRLRAADGFPDELVAALRTDPIRKGEGALGRLAIVGEPLQVPDIADPDSYQSHVREILLRRGYRSLLAIPLLREDHLLGGMTVNRFAVGEFAPPVIELLKTFASQSALAIQNARLFREIADKSRELEVASQHKSEFLANMSHELRTPLNAIIGFSEVLAERMFGEINDKQEEYLGDILDSARHLLALINDILDLSKIEAGRMELNLSDFHLSAAIDNTIVLMRERAHRRDITLSCVIDEKLGDIRADERKVKQVLLNLLSNALKFTPEGGRIDVCAKACGSFAEISVADTGVGIAPEDQATVFEEFRQVGIVSKRIEGTGLGLAISRKFVELHGGAIRVESAPGKGSTFAFTIPLDTAA